MNSLLLHIAGYTFWIGSLIAVNAMILEEPPPLGIAIFINILIISVGLAVIALN